jgi:hypothetical protein
MSEAKPLATQAVAEHAANGSQCDLDARDYTSTSALSSRVHADRHGPTTASVNIPSGLHTRYFAKNVESVLETISRARAAFFVANLSTVIIFTAVYNMYFTWLRHLLKRNPALIEDALAKEVAQKTLEALVQTRVTETTMLSIPVLGSRVAAADIGIFAALACTILAMWLYFAFRNENRAVAALTHQISQAPRSEEADYARTALANRFMFVTASEPTPVVSALEEFVFLLLMLGPGLSVLSAGMADIISLQHASQLYQSQAHADCSTQGCQIVHWIAGANANALGWHLNAAEAIEAIVRIAWTLFGAAVTLLLLSSAWRCYRATQRQFRGLMLAPGRSESGLPLVDPTSTHGGAHSNRDALA